MHLQYHGLQRLPSSQYERQANYCKWFDWLQIGVRRYAVVADYFSSVLVGRISAHTKVFPPYITFVWWMVFVPFLREMAHSLTAQQP